MDGQCGDPVDYTGIVLLFELPRRGIRSATDHEADVLLTTSVTEMRMRSARCNRDEAQA